METPGDHVKADIGDVEATEAGKRCIELDLLK
jgi:hypothetical protein